MLVVGGGKLLTSLIKAGLLDSLTIYTAVSYTHLDVYKRQARNAL